MTNLVPMTLHRVVDLPIGTIFRTLPDTKSARYGIVTADPGEGSTTLPFGLLGAGIGVPESGWYHVANGDRGVWVRRTDVADVRTDDVNVGA